MALVGLAEGLSAARIFAAREGYSIKANQELVGTGVANVASGFSGGMGVAGSLSKTAASRRSGGHAQLTGVFGAVIVLLVLAFLTEWLALLPRTVLSAIVIQAVWGLMDVSALRRYQSIRRNDFNAAVAAMIGVLLLGPLYGLLVAVGLAVMGLVYRSSRADLEVMGKVPDEKAAWGSIRDHPERRTYDGVVVIRLDAPLFWANSAEVCDRVLDSVDADPDVRALVLDLEATSQLDTTSIDALELLLERLKERDVELYLVRVFFRARSVLARAGFIEALGPEHMAQHCGRGQAARRTLPLKGKATPSPKKGQRRRHQHGSGSRWRDRCRRRRHCRQGRSPRGGYQDPYRTRPASGGTWAVASARALARTGHRRAVGIGHPYSHGQGAGRLIGDSTGRRHGHRRHRQQGEGSR